MRLCVIQKAREAGVDYVWAAVFATLHILLIWPWWEMVTLSARTHPLCVCVVVFFFPGGLSHQHAERSSGGSGL